VRVVLRAVDRAARRQEDDERDPDGDRGRGGGGGRVAQARPGAAADRQRHEQPEQQRGERGDDDQRQEVLRDRVAGLVADGGDVERSALRDLRDGGPVDRAQVDAQADGQPDGLEARAPVDQRDVEVEGALVAGGDREPDLADREVLRLGEGGHGAVAARQRGEQHEGHRQRPPRVGQRRRSHSCMSEIVR
jgi:hypothetical protein